MEAKRQNNKSKHLKESLTEKIFLISASVAVISLLLIIGFVFYKGLRPFIIEGYTLQKINLIHSSIELFLHSYRGISDKYIRNYIGLYKIKDKYSAKYHIKSIFYMIFKRIINNICELKYENFSSEFSFTMI